MINQFILQATGLALTVIGSIALVALTTIYGRPLSIEERRKVGEKWANAYRLPFNRETVIAALVLLLGVGILAYSKFDLCLLLAHWVPNLPSTMISMLQCN